MRARAALRIPLFGRACGLVVRPDAGAIEERHPALGPAMPLRRLQQAFPGAQARPAAEGLRRHPPRAQLGRDLAPLRAVVVPPDDRLDGAAQVVVVGLVRRAARRDQRGKHLPLRVRQNLQPVSICHPQQMEQYSGTDRPYTDRRVRRWLMRRTGREAPGSARSRTSTSMGHSASTTSRGGRVDPARAKVSDRWERAGCGRNAHGQFDERDGDGALSARTAAAGGSDAAEPPGRLAATAPVLDSTSPRPTAGRPRRSAPARPGVCQRSCPVLDQAASLILRSFVSRSGLRQTSPIGDQLRIWPDHRAGLAARASV